MTATIDPILEACLGVNGAITADLVIDILQETNPMVSMFVLKGVHVSLMELCRTGELVRISDPGEEAVYLRVADTPEIVPQTPEIVPENPAFVPHPGPYEMLEPVTQAVPDPVRNAILHMRCHFPNVTTVFYSTDGLWLFASDHMEIAELLPNGRLFEALDWELLNEAAKDLPKTPAVYRIPLEGRS